MKSLSEVAKQLGKSESGLRKLVVNRKIHFFQDGKHGRIMFEPEWVDEYISKNTHAPIDSAIPVSIPHKRKTVVAKMPETNKHGFNLDLCL
jgi:excisionase family DNA binding protein